MRSLSILTLVGLFGLGLLGCGGTPFGPEDFSEEMAALAPGDDAVVGGDVVIKVRHGIDVESVALGHGLQVGEKGHRGAFHIFKGNVGNEHSAAATLRADSRVEWAEPNYLRQPTAIDARLWAFYNPGGMNMKYTDRKRAGQTLPATYAAVADADMDNIEGYATVGAPVVVGSIDTGVQLTHPELAGRLLVGKDWYDNDADPSDSDGHGTHTSGTMAGSTVGVAGVAGAAPNVKVYVQRVCGKRGCPSAAIANAIRAAADVPDLVAMNLSLSGSSESQAEKDAVLYATQKNVLVIASAGNSGAATVGCPACDPSAISVAATNWKDEKATYSQYGSGLDLSAPGGQCYSNTTTEGCIYSAYKGSGYTWMQGTSMAAPQVTGTAAITASVTGLRGPALRARLESSADDLGAAGYDTTFGNGRINAYRAVTGTNLAVPQ